MYLSNENTYLTNKKLFDTDDTDNKELFTDINGHTFSKGILNLVSEQVKY